jgi:protein TonB
LGARLDAEAGLSGECIKTRQTQRCEDAQSDARADAEACRSLGVRSVLILPLLQLDELVGVFEVFSSQPAAFGKRDESTLHVLSQRVLASLSQTSQTLFTEDVAAAKRAGVSGENPDNSVAENFREADPAVENSITENFAAQHSANRQESSSEESTMVPEATTPVATSRGLNLLTWVLGVAVLAFALLLTVLIGMRLVRGKTATRVHPRADVSAKMSDEGRNPAPNNSSSETNEKRLDSASASRSGSAAPVNASDPPRVPASTAPHATSTPLGGGLQIFEKGKEIFRMPPTTEQSQQSNLGAKNGAASPDPGGAMEPSPVERAAIYEMSPEAASGSVVHRVEPEYPQEALEQKIQGAVTLDVRIAPDGAVEIVNLVTGQRLLGDAAIAAVKQWRFKPHLIKGQPVEVQTKVILNFRLPH